MSKHTPGPWEVVNGDAIKSMCQFIAFCAVGYKKVDDSRMPGESWLDMRLRIQKDLEAVEIEAKANARLIAAAPELLEALKSVISLMEAYGGISRNNFENLMAEEIEQANAAIAKATGVQS